MLMQNYENICCGLIEYHKRFTFQETPAKCGLTRLMYESGWIIVYLNSGAA